MIKHYRENIEIIALFLIGSVATGTERPDSDVDAVAIVSQDYFDQRKKSQSLEEVYFGKCTYEGGYFNTHYMNRKSLEQIAQNGSEPMRNMFACSRALFCHEPDLLTITPNIPVFQKDKAAANQLRFYCTFKMFYTYYWLRCKPQGFMRLHVADGMVYNLYRLILIENEILFPSARKLEEYVIRAPRKPDDIVEKCRRFMENLADDDCLALINSFEAWTTYDYPKDSNVIMNNFSDPFERI